MAPFPLQTYDDVRKRARQILEVVESRRMPPWKPEPGYGEFAGENRLREAEITLLKQWVEQGAVEGDPKQLPPVPPLSEDWAYGKPDLVVTMPEAYTLPAEGRNTYRAFVLPLNFSETRYVQAFQFRPSNRRILHHALLFLDTGGEYRRRDEADPGPGFSDPTLATTIFSGGNLGTWSPGALTPPFGEGLAKELKKGTDLVLHLHFTPTGKEEQEQSSIGFWFTKEPPRRTVEAVVMNELRLRIPAGANAARLQSVAKIPADVDLIGIGPHAHYLGKECRVWAKTPEGREIPLIWIKRWDFDWQGEYRFKEPIRLPKDTELRMLWVYDNSPDNPRNPSSPPKEVLYGPRSEDEMARVMFRIAPDHPGDILKFYFALGLIKSE